MASGKTKFGRELAKISGLGFADIDELFEEKYRISIVDFFEKYGEELFRQLERQVLIDTEQLDGMVIATGGGTPCFFDNMDFILRNGRSVYLRMPPAALANRLKSIRKQRPLLKDLKVEEIDQFIAEQLKAREPFYSRAEFTVDGHGPDLKALFELLKG
jgi:shikimate kinase